MRENILLVEDEEGLRTALSDLFRREGYVVDSAADGNSAYEKIVSLSFDLIILDIMLPGRDGLDICRTTRRLGIKTPILLLTGRAEAADKIAGLKVGADDYLTKPFDMHELLARIEALLRRPVPKVNVYECGSLRVDLGTMQATRDQLPVRLSAQELRLLLYFLRHAGQVLSREQILRDVWGYDAHTMTRTVDVHVSNLRQKLEKDPKRPELIQTIPALGYRFAA